MASDNAHGFTTTISFLQTTFFAAKIVSHQGSFSASPPVY
jgi:hypothetical protein